MKQATLKAIAYGNIVPSFTWIFLSWLIQAIRWNAPVGTFTPDNEGESFLVDYPVPVSDVKTSNKSQRSRNWTTIQTLVEQGLVTLSSNGRDIAVTPRGEIAFRLSQEYRCGLDEFETAILWKLINVHGGKAKTKKAMLTGLFEGTKQRRVKQAIDRLETNGLIVPDSEDDATQSIAFHISPRGLNEYYAVGEKTMELAFRKIDDKLLKSVNINPSELATDDELAQMSDTAEHFGFTEESNEERIKSAPQTFYCVKCEEYHPIAERSSIDKNVCNLAKRLRKTNADDLFDLLKHGSKRGFEILEQTQIKTYAALDRAVTVLRKREGITVKKIRWNTPPNAVYVLKTETPEDDPIDRIYQDFAERESEENQVVRPDITFYCQSCEQVKGVSKVSPLNPEECKDCYAKNALGATAEQVFDDVQETFTCELCHKEKDNQSYLNQICEDCVQAIKG